MIRIERFRHKDKKNTVLFQLFKDDDILKVNICWVKLHPSAVQVVEPASGCVINTIATDTILEFILRLRAGSLTCTVDGYSFILSMLHLKNVMPVLKIMVSYLSPLYENLVLFHNFFLKMALDQRHKDICIL